MSESNNNIPMRITQLEKISQYSDGMVIPVAKAGNGTFQIPVEIIPPKQSEVLNVINNFDLEYTSGYYISSTGTISAAGGYAYSEIINVNAGDELILDATGYQSNVAMISKYYGDGSYLPLVKSSSDSTRYTYIASMDMQIVLSFKTSESFNLRIIPQMGKTVDFVKSDLLFAESELDDLEAVVSTITFDEIESIGSVESEKNAQLASGAQEVSVVSGSSAYKMLTISNLTGIKYIKATCTLSSSASFGSGVICVDKDGLILSYYYGGNVGKTGTVTLGVKVPRNCDKVYVNGVSITPTAYKSKKVFSFAGVTEEEAEPLFNLLTDVNNLNYVSGYYITGYGTKATFGTYHYSESFHLKPCKLMVKAQGEGNGTIAIISRGATSDERVVPITRSSGSDYKWYFAEITEEDDYLVCGKIANEIIVCYFPYPETKIPIEYSDLSMFEKIGVVGDSYASGELYYNSAYHDKYNISWGQVLARKHGITCTNYSSGGLSTRSWLTAQKGLPLVLANAPENLYFLMLGINDATAQDLGPTYLGTIDDIKEDYTLNADTFYGNYGKIIAQIMIHSPNAKLVMSTMANNTGDYASFNTAIIAIANHFEIPYIVQRDDDFFTSTFYENTKVSGHPVAMAYAGMADAIDRLTMKCIFENQNYFKNYYMYD